MQSKHVQAYNRRFASNKAVNIKDRILQRPRLDVREVQRMTVWLTSLAKESTGARVPDVRMTL